MKTNIKNTKRPIASWITLVKICVSAALLFWIYLIWSSATTLKDELNTKTDKSLAVHDLQVEFKNEVHEWKNFLLRSNNKESFDKNWQTFEAKYRSVAASTQDILNQSDSPRVTESLKEFLAAHSENFERYKQSRDAFIKSGFTAHQADVVVAGIDRPLLDILEKGGVAMQEEISNDKDRIVSKAIDHIEQSLLVLALISLILVWLPKW